MNIGRSSIIQYDAGIEIIIPARRSLFVNCFLLFWSLAWAYGEYMVIDRLLEYAGQSPDAFIVIFACGWSLSGLLACYIWIWNNRGREIIRIGDAEMKRSREYIWFSRSTIYQTCRICNFRISDTSPAALETSGGMEFWGLAGGAISFDYGTWVEKIGLGIDESEAERIIAAIKNRYGNF